MVELIPIGSMSGELRKPHVLIGTPSGRRVIYELESGRIEGERLRATLKGTANGDWMTIGPDGTGTLDVRLLCETHDGALVFLQYRGRVEATSNGRATVYAAPTFETGDERYAWLNRIQAVAKGVFDGRTLTYELFEVR